MTITKKIRQTILCGIRGGFLLIAAMLFSLGVLADEADEARRVKAAAPVKPANPGETLFVLDGRMSVGSSGDALEYRWRQLSGPEVWLSDDRSPVLTFHARRAGLYDFELVVLDDGVASEPCVIRIEVEPERPLVVLPEPIRREGPPVPLMSMK